MRGCRLCSCPALLLSRVDGCLGRLRTRHLLSQGFLADGRPADTISHDVGISRCEMACECPVAEGQLTTNFPP